MLSWWAVRLTCHCSYRLADKNIWSQHGAEPELRSLVENRPMWQRLWKGAQAGHSVPIFSCINTNTQMKQGVSHHNMSAPNARQRKEKKTQNNKITVMSWSTKTFSLDMPLRIFGRTQTGNMRLMLFMAYVILCHCIWKLLSENYIMGVF